jgi:hypothetical protein
MANNVNRESVVKSAMSRAAKLMQLESNGTLDKIAAAHKDGINSSLDGDVTTQDLMTTARNRKTEAPMITREMGENASNVPAAIREAFMNNPIDESSLYGAFTTGGDGSLDFLNEMAMPQQQPQITQPTQDVRQIVNEGMGYMASSQPQVSAQIDYPMIRTIVEEIVRKYAVSLKKNILAESKQTAPISQVNTIALGETFKFLTKDGTIYECTMRKVGNINNKKKSVNG